MHLDAPQAAMPLVWILHRIDLYQRPRAALSDTLLETFLGQHAAANAPNAIRGRFAWCWTDPCLIRLQVGRMRLRAEGPPDRKGRPRNAFLEETDFGPVFRAPGTLWGPLSPPGAVLEPRALADSILRDYLRWGPPLLFRRLRTGRLEQELPWVTPAEMFREVWGWFRLFDGLP